MKKVFAERITVLAIISVYIIGSFQNKFNIVFFDSLKLFSNGFRIIIGIMILLGIIFFKDKWFKKFSLLKKIDKRILLVILFVAFLLFHNKNLMHDSELFLESIKDASLKKPYVINNLFFILFYKFLNLFNISSIWTIRIIDALFGTTFVFLSLKTSKYLSRNKWLVIFIFLISVGSTKIFFGDIESYAPVIVLILTYILFSIKYLRKEISINYSIISLSILTLFHTWGVIFFPSLLLLSIIREGEKNILKVFVGYFLPIIFVTTFFYIFQTGIVPENKIIYSHIFSPPIEDVYFRYGNFLQIHPYLCVNCLCDNFCSSQKNYNGYLTGYTYGGLLPLFKSNSKSEVKQPMSLFSKQNILNKTLFAVTIIGPIILFVFFQILNLRKKLLKDNTFLFLSSLVLLEIIRIYWIFTLQIQMDWNSISLFAPIFSVWTGYIFIKYKNEQTSGLLLGLTSCLLLIFSIIKDALF